MLWLRRMARCGMFIVYAFIIQPILDISTHIPSIPKTSARIFLNDPHPTLVPSARQTSKKGLLWRHTHTLPFHSRNEHDGLYRCSDGFSTTLMSCTADEEAGAPYISHGLYQFTYPKTLCADPAIRVMEMSAIPTIWQLSLDLLSGEMVSPFKLASESETDQLQKRDLPYIDAAWSRTPCTTLHSTILLQPFAVPKARTNLVFMLRVLDKPVVSHPIPNRIE